MSKHDINANHLIEAYGRLRKASGWKASTQRFEINLLSEVTKLQQELDSQTYKPNKGTCFVLNEQGRLRLIRALEPRDMILEHALCDNILNPLLRPYLIHDNGASIKGKGISFTRRRFEQQLHKFYRTHDRNGYILKLDFRKFFDNIHHKVLLDTIGEKVKLPATMDTLRVIVENNSVDITGFEDSYSMSKIYNALEHFQKRVGSKNNAKGKSFLHKSLAIGAPISQISGIYLPSRIDSWCKTVRGVKYYNAYMDDRIVIHHDKEFLRKLLKEITDIALSLGIHINRKKTQIIKLTCPFTFLKTRYLLTPTGKLIRKIPKDVVSRVKRVMRKLADLVVEGKMSLRDFKVSYKSWRNDKKRYNAYYTLKALDNYERKLISWISQTRPTPYLQTA